MKLETESQAAYRNIDAGQCPGCPSNMATKLVMNIVFEACKARHEDPIIFGQGCGIGRNFLSRSAIGTHDSGCVALKVAMELRGIDRPVVVLDGDGQLDMGFDDFSGAFQQGLPYVHIVCDNQTYAASGTHATGMTDLLSRVSTRPNGRVGHKQGRLIRRKQPAMMIMFSGARYSATASPIHLRDFERKIINALDNMPAFIQVFTPCNTAWGFNDDQAAHITRLGVECGIWPLWEWHNGLFRRTVSVDVNNIDSKLKEYLAAQRRYRHVTDDETAEIRAYIDELDTLVSQMARAFSKPGEQLS